MVSLKKYEALRAALRVAGYKKLTLAAIADVRAGTIWLPTDAWLEYRAMEESMRKIVSVELAA